MRTYGKINNVWSTVQTDANQHDDYVWITTLLNNLNLVLGESPLYAQNGIPAQDSLVTQVFPDFYVSKMQQEFAPHFFSLKIYKTQSRTPTYQVDLITKKGTAINQVVAV